MFGKGSNLGPHRACNLNMEEQKSQVYSSSFTAHSVSSNTSKPHFTFSHNVSLLIIQMTLWSIAKSPLMFGGDVRKLDDATYNLITNPTLLEINSYSSNNKEVCRII